MGDWFVIEVVYVGVQCFGVGQCQYGGVEDGDIDVGM